MRVRVTTVVAVGLLLAGLVAGLHLLRMTPRTPARPW